MADFFARLAARLLDEDTERLRPNLPTRFAPAPEIGLHAAPVVLSRHEPAAIPPASAPRPRPSRGQPSASAPDHSSAPSHSQPAAQSGDRPDAATSRYAVLAATLLGPAAGEPAELAAPVPPANTASVAPAKDGLPRAAAGPAWRPGDTAIPERDRAAAPGEERRPDRGPRLPRHLATPAGEPTAFQPPGAGEVPAGEAWRTGGAQPAPAAGQPAPAAGQSAQAAGQSAQAAGQSAQAAGQSAQAAAGDPPDAVTPPLSEPARAPDSSHQSSPPPAVSARSSGTHPTVPPVPPAPRGAIGGSPGLAAGRRAGSGEPLRRPGVGPPVTDDATVRDDVSGARSGLPPATARRDPPSEPRLTSPEPARRPRAGSGTGEAPVRDGHIRRPAPDSGRTQELTVDIEVLEIVERQPPSRPPSARVPPVSLSDYLTRRAR